jgi:carbohydrate diacid regulator
MILSKNVADQIVKELSQIVEQHINVMDIQGVIISSTDSNRIGTIHGGALKIIEENLPELVIESNDQFPGSKNGINLPIAFQGAIIGVIGMTGIKDEVYKYGQIIKKMTEILLLDSFVREQHLIEQKAKDRFLEEWIFGRYEVNHPLEFEKRAESLGIDIKTKKRLMVFGLKKGQEPVLDDLIQTDISSSIRKYFKTLNQAFMFRTSTLFISVINNSTDEQMLNIAKNIEKIVAKYPEITVYIGIDSKDDKPINISFKNANAALLYRLLYLQKLFGDINFNDIRETIELLRMFYLHEGSLQKISDALFIHKNTLQYRLNKIQSLTSHDPRNLSETYLFIVAIKMFDSLDQ